MLRAQKPIVHRLCGGDKAFDSVSTNTTWKTISSITLPPTSLEEDTIITRAKQVFFNRKCAQIQISSLAPHTVINYTLCNSYLIHFSYASG